MRILTILIIVFNNYSAITQATLPGLVKNRPVVGSRLPDFVLNDISHFRQKKATLNDFKGKWLILDFWTFYCSACIRNFPKINNFQKIFKKEIQFILIGNNSVSETSIPNNIQSLYEKLRVKYRLELASVYDSVLFDQYEVYTVPHIIIISPDGIVKAVTSSAELTEENLKDMISGKAIDFFSKDHSVPNYEISKFPGSETNKLFYRSILTKGNGERACRSRISEFIVGNDEQRKNGIKIVMHPLKALYQIAYFDGVTWEELGANLIYPEPIVEVADSSLFQFDYNSSDFKGLFNYNLAVPILKSKDSDFIKSIFQQELKNVFGYNVILEKRSIPVWKLVASEGAGEKLRSKTDGPSKWDGLHSDIRITNYSLDKLIKGIWYYHQNDIPFINETNITHNIDIELAGFLYNLEDVRRSLRKYGLDLIKGRKEMTVLIIRDAQ